MNLSAIIDKGKAAYNYFFVGVWKDPRDTIWIRMVKCANLALNSFMDRGLQLKSMALTYSTVLAIVPACALLVAIGRGFGMQDNMQHELFTVFPSQAKAISTALKFVDSYLSQASQGVFVGVGIIMLLWTLISLLSSIEDAFNSICDVKQGRTLYQKVTDYISICLIVPVLMICSSGVSIFMSSTIQSVVKLPFLTPLVDIMLEAFPVLLAWLAFSFSFFLIPNTKINFKYAAIAGAVCAITFQILQMLMVSGQIYVSKYNAIYGSFAFLPLLLIWLQMSWLILLSGCVLTYSLQNVFAFNFLETRGEISENTEQFIALVVMTIVVQDFLEHKKPRTISQISSQQYLPVRVVRAIVERLDEAGYINSVKLSDNEFGLAPSSEVYSLTAGDFLRTYSRSGSNQLLEVFNNIYDRMLPKIKPAFDKAYDSFNNLFLKDLPVPTPQEITEALRKAAGLKPSK